MKRPYSSSPLPTRRLPALSVSQGDIQSGKDRKDEIETFPHWLCDYKSTNQTDEGQMRAENSTSIPQYLVGGMRLKDGRIWAVAAADLFQREGRATGR